MNGKREYEVVIACDENMACGRLNLLAAEGYEVIGQCQSLTPTGMGAIWTLRLSPHRRQPLPVSAAAGHLLSQLADSDIEHDGEIRKLQERLATLERREIAVGLDVVQRIETLEHRAEALEAGRDLLKGSLDALVERLAALVSWHEMDERWKRNMERLVGVTEAERRLQ